MTSTVPIEDEFEDIIAKTMRGRQVTEAELQQRTGVSQDILHRLCRGEFCDEPALLEVAKALDLDSQALTMSASKVWRPRTVELEGLAMTNTPYRDMRVNAFLVWDPASGKAAAFDTGTDSSLLTAQAGEKELKLEAIFLTHTHNDHIADLDRLRADWGDIPAYANEDEPWPGATLFSEGDEFSIGGLSMTTKTTSGHSVGGTTYYIEGLERPVAVVGDAMFAGSMGGGMVSFEDAWSNNREKILTLPDDTVLCPGHGPMTSVGEEKRNNPFFAREFR